MSTPAQTWTQPRTRAVVHLRPAGCAFRAGLSSRIRAVLAELQERRQLALQLGGPRVRPVTFGVHYLDVVGACDRYAVLAHERDQAVFLRIHDVTPSSSSRANRAPPRSRRRQRRRTGS